MIGLDSSTAFSVIESLKQIATQKNSTIVMTIHQPSARLFGLLDKVMFLSGGYVTYFGGANVPLQTYIHNIYKEASLGDVPIGNLPEIFLDLSDQLIIENRVNILTDKYQLSESTLNRDISTITHTDHAVASYANSFLGDLMFLSERAFLNVLRTKELFVARLGASIFFGIQIGTLFLKTDEDDDGLRFRTAYFVFTLAFYFWTSLEALPIFIAERETFQREYSSGAYRAISYTLSSILVTLPANLFLAFIYTCITWWLVGLPNLATIFFFDVLITFMVLTSGMAFATMISTLIPNAMTGQTIGS